MAPRLSRVGFRPVGLVGRSSATGGVDRADHCRKVGPGVLFVCAGNAMRLRVVEPAVSPAAVADSPAASVQLQQPMALKAARPAARPAFASAALAAGDKAQTVVDLNLSSHTMPVPCLIWRCCPWRGAADGSQK
ncbi:uncharacterized protein Triagg1_705 [Trichoderma aggressivum f. europaeum]|uniref:Uncharacterized protein n=1 Tax=Trichoderma aggressivum f. europaeum TaxID=173218 RepID=A0AAE1JE45_9HYPO|nr:hypothetical protein Triagg1_705 [Trichoderma aggressivum f. europaeum]